MKYKVYNNNSFNIGLKLENPSRELSLKANTYIMLEEEDILYLNSVSKLFSAGYIYVEDKEMLENMGYLERNPNTISKKEIAKILESGNAAIKSGLSKITEKHAISKVVDVIKEGKVDLSQSAIKIINDSLGIDINQILQELED